MAKSHPHEPEFFGSATVGERGQIVIPADARQKLEIKPGDKLLIFSRFPGPKGLLIMKSEQVSRFVSSAVARLTKMEELAREEDK